MVQTTARRVRFGPSRGGGSDVVLVEFTLPFALLPWKERILKGNGATLAKMEGGALRRSTRIPSPRWGQRLAEVGDTQLQPRDFRCPVFVSRSVRSSSFFFKESAGARTSQRDFLQKATKGTKIFPNSDSIAKLRRRRRLLAHKAGELHGVFTGGSEEKRFNFRF